MAPRKRKTTIMLFSLLLFEMEHKTHYENFLLCKNISF